MKQKCTFILKTSIAIVLALMMLIGSISSVIAATVDIAESGANFVVGSKIYYNISNGPDWWKNGGAGDNESVKFGSGSWLSMTKMSDNWFSIEVPTGTNTNSITFGRGTTSQVWNQFTKTDYPGGCKNVFYLSGEGTGDWGYYPTTVKDQYIYFDNTNGFLNKTNKYFVVGHDSFYRIHKLNKVSGTENLYYCNNTYDWSDSLYVGVFSASNDWQSGSDPKDVNNKNWTNDVVANADGYKAVYSGEYAFNDGNSVLLTTSAASNSATLTPTYLSGYAALNSDLTVKTMLYSDSAYAETSTKCGTFSVSSSSAKKMNGNGTTNNSSFSQTTGTGTLSTARTNAATISQTNVTGYTFQGWKAAKDTTGSSLTTGTYSFTNAGSGGTIYAYYRQAAAALTAPTLKYNNATTTPVTLTTHTTASLTWASVSNASSYTVFKDGSSYQINATSPFTVSETGEYTVKAIGNGTTYSDSDASNAIQVNIPIEFYVKNSADWDFSKMKYYLYGGSGAAGAWEGTSMDGDTKTTYVGKSGGKDVYKITIVTDDTYVILVETGSKQTKGSNDPNSALSHGKVYTTVSTDNGSTTSSNFSDLVMDTAYNLTYSGSNCTIAGTKPSTAYSGTTVSFEATASSGYVITSVTYTPSGGSATACTKGTGNEYHFTMPDKNTTVTVNTAQTYSVSVVSADTTKGTVASASVTANGTNAVTLPTATAKYGYKFTGWTVTSGGSSITLTNASSATSATVKATATGTVTANFAKDDGMNLYIAGRFHIYKDGEWKNCFDSGNWSSTGNSNTKMVWDSTAQKYKLDTGASPAELTTQISGYDPFFFVYDSKTGATKNWYASSSTTLTNTTKSVTLTSSGGANNNLKFNATSTDKPVTLWFDPTTGVLSYTVPDFYDVTVNTATGGTVTAAPTRTTNSTVVTLTIHPDDGYQLNTITATKTGASGTTVSLSGSGNAEGATRTFTMPAYGVTVTPTFSKVNYALNKVDATNGSFKLSSSSTGEPQISTAKKGDTVYIVPTANTGYEVDKVYWGSATNPSTVVTASSGKYSVTMTSGAKYFKVTFKAINYTITSSKTGNGSYTIKKSGASSTTTTYNIGDTLVISATPNDYNHLTNIVVSGAVSGTYTSSPVNLDMTGKTGALTVTVNFAETSYTGLTTEAKSSTTGASGSYNTTMSYVPTKSADSATNAAGITVTADATKTEDGATYRFYKWSPVSTDGTVADANALSTTFYPKKNGAVAIALYKKVYTITSSIDGTGKGAGEVATSVDSVVAGGSYTITSTAKSNSRLESVKINNTAQTTTSPLTINNVTADQNVVVKFASNPHLIGGLATNNWTEPGDELTSNAAGTSFSITVSGKAAGEYEFKHYSWNGSAGAYDATAIAAANQTLNGIASLDNTGTNGNYKLVLSVQANITLTSDGSKFTAITVVPDNVPTYNVTLKKVANTTITATYMGVEYSTASADAVVPVYQGTELSFTVTPASGYYVSGLTGATFTPAFTQGESYTGKIANVTAVATVTPEAASKPSITATTNKSDRGTVTVSPTSAAPGETITISYAEKDGVLNTLSYTVSKKNASSETVTLYPSASGNSSQGQNASSGRKDKIELAATGDSGSYTVTVPQDTTGISVSAVYDAYSAPSQYYYNGFNTSGTVLSDYDAEQMTEVMLNGVPYSYYYVEGRTGSEQLMTVSKGSSDTKFYVETPDISDWNNSDPQIYWFDDNWGTFTTMHWVRNISGNKKLWYVSGSEIHPGQGCLIINGKTGSDRKQTTDMSADEVAYGAVWIRSDQTDGKYNWQRYDSGDKPADAGDQTVHYYYNDSDRYYGNVGELNDTANTWDSYNANNHTFARPHSPSGDYYVMVFYAGNTYTYGDNTTLNLSSSGGANHDVVMWAYELPSGGEENVTVYAKDGSIRTESYGVTYANIADTKIYSDANHTTAVGTDHSGQISGQTYETYKAEKGQTIYIRTIINNTAGTGANTQANNAKYYVRGFCVNGVVSKINSGTSAGTSVTGGTAYDLTYTVPEEYEDKYIEITPIYYLADTTNNPIVTFRVLDFPKDKYNWGDTLYAYPFYGAMGSQNNAFGAYPGQPVVYYNGQYSIQIPEKSTAWDPYLGDDALSGESSDAAKKTKVANTFVSGITMSNGYYDSVHRTVMGYGGNGTSSDHVQTYDYGDFYKIFNEKKPVDNIVYDFKYRTAKHNFENQPASSTTKSTLVSNYGTSGNGFELLKNFHGKNVDLFGTPLSGDAADPIKTTPVYVVSIGGVNGTGGVENIAGYYATEWMVYGSSDGTNYSRITGGNKESIPPEVLVLNDDDTTSFNTTTYPSAVDGKNITDWKALYTALEAYRGKPVYISYEAADAQIGSGNYATSGGGGATRNDGRWLYSKTGESITSNIKIQYSTDNGVNYTDLNTASPQVTGLSAFFTNSEVSEGATTFSTTIDPDKTFNFDAETTNASYMFVGWYMDDSNNTLITTDNEGSTERSGSYTFIARFKQVTSGQLVMQHSKASGSAGDGTTLISAVVKNGSNETVATYTDAASITIPGKYIKSTNTDYTVEVTLKATPSGYDTYSSTSLANAGGDVTTAKYYNNPSSSTSGSTRIQTFSFSIGDLYTGTTQDVNTLLYASSFNKTTFTYDFTFSYNGRLANGQSYKRAGTLTAAQVKDYVTGTAPNYTLRSAFITSLAPSESNFNETLIWSISDKTISSGTAFTETYNAVVYNASPEIEGEKLRSTARTVTFNLPYAHTDGVADGSVIGYGITSSDLNISLAYGDLILNDEDHITAPTTVTHKYDDNTENDKTEYFQYWAVYKLEDSGAHTQLVTKCFSDQFNYLAYDSYYIVPVYAETKLDYQSEDLISSSISYLDTTRNQWNNGGNGGYTIEGQTARNKASDLLFNDFALSYNYGTERLYENNDAINGNDVEVGFIVEKVQKMDLKQDGTYDSNVSKYIVTDVDEENHPATDAKNDAQAAIENITVSSYGAQAGAKNSAYANYTKYKLDRTQLDNKNRIEFYYALYNAYGDSNNDYLFDSKTANKNYVYRAYSYIKVGEQYYVTDDPVYFIMYDEATK